MSDLYSSKRNPGDIAKGVFEQTQSAGLNRANQYFGNAAMERSMAKRGEITGNMIKGAIEVFGVDTVRNWQAKSADIRNELRQRTQMIKREAIRARQQGDMDRYNRLMSQILFDRELAAYAEVLDKARKNQIASAIAGYAGGFGLEYLDTAMTRSLEQPKKSAALDVSTHSLY